MAYTPVEVFVARQKTVGGKNVKIKTLDSVENNLKQPPKCIRCKHISEKNDKWRNNMSYEDDFHDFSFYEIRIHNLSL